MYFILKRIYNKNGINDGINFQVVDNHFNTISNHKNELLAQKKLNKLKEKYEINN